MHQRGLCLRFTNAYSIIRFPVFSFFFVVVRNGRNDKKRGADEEVALMTEREPPSL